jgi:hypothetical protein
MYIPKYSVAFSAMNLRNSKQISNYFQVFTVPITFYCPTNALNYTKHSCIKV